MTADMVHRESAVQETARSFAVEASAGTGKTRTLIDRILTLVLERGPQGLPLPLQSVCAITFTEKAAGELKMRLREALEREAQEPGERGERAAQAIRDLDFATISTIHSFAVSLLKERPIEAGLDPRFTALDEAGRQLLFDETWDRWLHAELLRRSVALESALRQGLVLGQLRELARELSLRYHQVLTLEPVVPMTEAQERDQLRQQARKLEALASCLTDPSDKLAARLNEALEWLADPTCSVRPSKSGNVGRGAAWGGKSNLIAVRNAIAETVALSELSEDLPSRRLLYSLIVWLRDEFLPVWDRRKVEGGVLDFDDQVQRARDLLRSSPAALREFRSRYRAILVDEFQDTDSVQLDLVLLLSSDEPDVTGRKTLQPGPGRLFFVGDPKQSIYRFRGADIESYMSVTDSDALGDIALGKLELTTNFRSVPGILRFVDFAFEPVMKKSEAYQPAYLAFGGSGNRQPQSPGTCVHLLAERDSEGRLSASGRGFAEAEARDVSRLIAEIHGNPGWAVSDSGGQPRLPRWGDIAVLMPVLTRADLLEDELRELGIPYVLEGGKFYYVRSEVSSAVTVLSSVANPNDRVALYGSLRSIFFGLSDEDLLEAHIAGITLDYRRPLQGGGPLSRAFTLLRRLHELREQRPASETLEDLLLHTGAREVLAAHGLQSVANLGKLVRKLRSVQAGKTFFEVVRYVRSLAADETAESECRLMEERADAVRIMSVHRSKGLDFRIAMVAGLGFERRKHRGSFVADAHLTKSFALRAGRWTSEGWDALMDEDAKREDAELVRLLYVALTRARDHLVVSVRARKGYSSQGKLFAGTRLVPLAPALEEAIHSPPEGTRWIESGFPKPSSTEAAESEKDEIDVARRLVSEKQELHRLREVAAIAAELPAAKAGPATETGPANRGVRLGLAFHEVMEVLDVRSDALPMGLVDEAATRHSLDVASRAELDAMLAATLGSRLFERMRAALLSGGRVCREVPFFRRAAEVEEGKVDLLFEESGRWILVDYKTDRIPEGTAGEFSALFLGRYSMQIVAYASALSDAGVTIGEGWLLAARTGVAVQVPLPNGNDKDSPR